MDAVRARLDDGALRLRGVMITDTQQILQGPDRAREPRHLGCCGDPKNLGGNAHPWVLVTEDGPGDVYECPDCGAVDVD
jgi:hypothetical protein